MQRGDKLVSFFLGRNNPTFCHPKKKPQLECQGRCQDALEVHPRRDKTMYLEAGCGIVGRLRRIGVALGSSPGSSRVCSVVFAPPEARVLSGVLPPRRNWSTNGPALNCLPSIALDCPMAASSYPSVASSYPIVARAAAS